MTRGAKGEQAAEQPKASEASGAGGAVVVRKRNPFVRVPVVLECSSEEDRTQQSFRDDCDINVLMKRFERTGVFPVGRDAAPQYLDVSAIDFQSSMDRIAQVNGVFSQLDARTRARFENNPELMLEFLADPSNRAEAVKLGLMAKEVEDGTGKATEGAGSAGQVGSASARDGAAGSAAASADQGAPGGAAEGGAGGNAGAGG